MVRAVFLDRDGVINQSFIINGKPVPPRRIEDFYILADVPRALDRLKAAGFVLIVATNQPDVAQRLMTIETLEAMHRMLRQNLPQIDDVRVCLHSKDAGCLCHKPQPGMLFDAASDWSIDLSRSVIVGDRWRDISAGHAAGCITGFVDLGYQELLLVQPTFVCRNLNDAATQILKLDREKP